MILHDPTGPVPIPAPTALTDETCGFYAGLNADGEVIQVFASPDDFENRNDSVVSIGYVEAIPTDYDEIFRVTPR